MELFVLRQTKYTLLLPNFKSSWNTLLILLHKDNNDIKVMFYL